MKLEELRILALPILVLLAGCGQGDIRVYRVAKEAAQPEQTAQADTGSVPPGAPRYLQRVARIGVETSDRVGRSRPW